MNEFQIVGLVIVALCGGVLAGAAGAYFAAMKILDDMNQAIVDAIDTALFKVDADARKERR